RRARDLPRGGHRHPARERAAACRGRVVEATGTRVYGASNGTTSGYGTPARSASPSTSFHAYRLESYGLCLKSFWDRDFGQLNASFSVHVAATLYAAPPAFRISPRFDCRPEFGCDSRSGAADRKLRR